MGNSGSSGTLLFKHVRNSNARNQDALIQSARHVPTQDQHYEGRKGPQQFAAIMASDV
jgi:hypothetical protein